jgi:hypothetical protein
VTDVPVIDYDDPYWERKTSGQWDGTIAERQWVERFEADFMEANNAEHNYPDLGLPVQPEEEWRGGRASD